MTKLYLIRHTEAEGNLYRLAQGHYNGKVTVRGAKQIAALAERFKDIHIDTVYASDLERAKETAKGLAVPRDLDLNIDPDLREINMGVWEGMPWGEIAHRWPEGMETFSVDPQNWVCEGSEPYEQVKERMLRALGKIVRENDGKTVAVVSHGMAIKIVLMHFLGIDPASKDAMLHGDNTSVSYIEFLPDGTHKVIFYNDNSHLGELSVFARHTWQHTKGKDKASFRYEPLDLNSTEGLECFFSCYEDSWRFAHGSLNGFEREFYDAPAKKCSEKDANCVVKVLSGRDFAGLLQLDPSKGKICSWGWISLLYLTPESRGKGHGVQLVGYAAEYYKRLGRKALRLHVAAPNKTAYNFYLSCGFTQVGVDQGVVSEQYVMEKIL